MVEPINYAVEPINYAVEPINYAVEPMNYCKSSSGSEVLMIIAHTEKGKSDG